MSIRVTPLGRWYFAGAAFWGGLVGTVNVFNWVRLCPECIRKSEQTNRQQEKKSTLQNVVRWIEDQENNDRTRCWLQVLSLSVPKAVAYGLSWPCSAPYTLWRTWLGANAAFYPGSGYELLRQGYHKVGITIRG
jgi:hypothetical protein